MCGVRGSLQVITPFRKLILCAENRKEMEDWIGALKSVQKWEIHEVGQPWARGAESPEVGSSGAGWGVKGGVLRVLTEPAVPRRPRSSTWSTSRACTTGTPAPTPGPPSATSAGKPSRGSPPTASPAKVSTLGGDMGRCPWPWGWGPSSLFLLFLPSVQVQGPQALRRAGHQQLQVDHAGLHRHGNHRGRGRGEPAGGPSWHGHLPRVVARG